MFLCWSSTKIVQAIWICQKTWPPGGRGLFLRYIYIENFQNFLVRNHWTDFHIILQKCSFCDPLPRLFESFGFVKKHGRQGAGLIFPIYLYRKLEKIFLSETTAPISILFCRNVPLVILFQDCSSNLDSSKNMAARGRGLISLYIDIENFKNLLVRNHWTNFHLILQKYSFCDPLPRLFKPFGFVKKHGRQGAGLIFTIYIYIENLKNLLVRNHWTDFNITWLECFFCNPLVTLFKISWFVKKHGRQWVGLFSPYIYIENFQKYSCQKRLDRFQYRLTDFPSWPSTKIVQAVMICQKIWPLGGGSYFPYIYIENLKKIFLTETTGPISM